VQDPAQAQVEEMPVNVLRHTKTEHCLPVDQIAPLLVRLSGNGEEIGGPNRTTAQCEKLDDEETLPITEPLAYTCPECGGSHRHSSRTCHEMRSSRREEAHPDSPWPGRPPRSEPPHVGCYGVSGRMAQMAVP
jgi:hypothetical protein